MSDLAHAGWAGSRDPLDRSGTGTFNHGGKTVQVRFQCFEDYFAVLETIQRARLDALRAQAEYLRGAINNLLEQR